MRTCSTTRLLIAALAAIGMSLASAGAALADPSDFPAPAPRAEPPPSEDAPVDEPPPAEEAEPTDEAKPEAVEPEDVTPEDVTPDDGATTVLEDVTALEPADIAVEPEPVRSRPRLRRLPIHGSFRLNYRLRWDGDDADNDLYQYLILNYGDDHQCGWSYAFHGRLTQDLDGRSDKNEFFVFDSITDTYDSWINGRVYHLYANYRPRGGPVRLVRIGRQWVEGGELFHVDGVRVDIGDSNSLEAATWGLSLYGGLPAHLFEGTPEGDAILGFSIYHRPWRGAKARLDYAFLNDDTRYYGTETAHLVTLTLRQQFNQNASWWASYQHLDEDPRTLRLAGNMAFPAQDMFVRGAFFSQLSTQTQTVTDLDPYFFIGQTLEPYWTGDLSVSKGVGERLFFEAGVSLRQLYDDDDESTFNREYVRYYGAASLEDWPCRDGSVTVTGERWNSADDAWTVTADFEYRPSRRFKLQLGTDYSAYRFDYYTAGERQSVRGYYLRVIMRTSERWRMHLRCRVEDDKFDTYLTLNTGFTLEF
ncbi:MAG: hypothetical protein QNJ90_10405 [Planctomycetota bacterium]|nr:hypothetical protein [Planctomycetota bacterium]